MHMEKIKQAGKKLGAVLAPLGIIGACCAGEVPAARENHHPGLAALAARLQSGENPVRIVCFGDSITGVYYHTGGRRAWCDMLGIALQQAYPGARLEMHNAGISGNKTTAGLARMERDVLACRPDLVVIMFGMNDCKAGQPEKYQDNLRTMVQRGRAAGAAIILCTPNSVYPEDQERFANLPGHAAAVRALAAELDVPLADCYRDYEELRAADPLAWQLLMSETIHPGMHGHRRFAQTIAAVITGREIVLKNIPPPAPALTFTFDRLSRREPVKLIAVPPYDVLLPPVLQKIYPGAVIEVTPWPPGSLAEMEKWSKGLRERKPTLAVVAVPARAQAADSETFIRSYNWILNWSLAFGRPEWDTLAILPAVAEGELSGDARRFADLAQRVVEGKDISFIARAAGDHAEPQALLQRWIEAAHQAWAAGKPGTARPDPGH